MGAAWVDMGGFSSAGMLERGLAKFPPARVRIAHRPLSLGERCGWRSSRCPLEGSGGMRDEGGAGCECGMEAKAKTKGRKGEDSHPLRLLHPPDTHSLLARRQVPPG